MLRILLVDDERLYCENLTRTLSARGYHVRTASSGEEGIALGMGFRPHVLVTDWLLRTAMVGSDVVAALRRELPHLCTVLITGFPIATEESGRTRSDQFHEVVAKPFRTKHLLAAIDRALAAERSPIFESYRAHDAASPRRSGDDDR